MNRSKVNVTGSSNFTSIRSQARNVSLYHFGSSLPLLLYSTAQHAALARHDTTRHDTTRHDTTRHDSTRTVCTHESPKKSVKIILGSHVN